jgi:hypothetical protein
MTARARGPLGHHSISSTLDISLLAYETGPHFSVKPTSKFQAAVRRMRLTGVFASQTAPGGWIEIQDLNTHGYSEDGSASEDNMFFKFCQIFNRACDKMGRTGSPGQHLKGWVEEAGFKNVQHKMLKVPLGPWPEDLNLVGAERFYSVTASASGG